MTTIRLVFPAGRYHGTPWGRHVNEGVPEWPPSPYRLLRALYDVWQRKCFDLAEHEVREVLEGLGASVPRFTLPDAVATHTRSYLSANAKDPADKNLVFDSFLVFDRPHACFISWRDLDFSPASSLILNHLLNNLNFLGRSESWVQAEVWSNPIEGGHVCDAAGAVECEGELTSVACVAPPSEHEGKARWIDALTFSTSNLLKERASSPPLLRHVRYVLPRGAIVTDPVRRHQRSSANVQSVLLGLDATVLPLVTTTLEVAEQIRVRLMGAHKRRMENDETRVSSVFSGKTAHGEKRLDHGHVYILPLASRNQGKQGRIDRVLILNPNPLQPFSEDELDAVRGVRELYQPGRPSVRCVVTWQGSLDSPVERKPATVLVSTTPFVPPHHWRKGRDFLQFLTEQVRRECRHHRVGATPSEVELLKTMPGLFDVVEYRRNRKDDPVRPGYALRLTFQEKVLAPFAIGYGAHFGLGQFEPEQSHTSYGGYS